MLLKLRVDDALGIVNAILRLAWGNRNLSPDENQHITIARQQVRRPFDTTAEREAPTVPLVLPSSTSNFASYAFLHHRIP